MKILKILIVVAVVGFIAIQFYRPAKTNPKTDESRTLTARLQPPPEVAAVLQKSCQDCHSNKTTWQWYSQIAPVSWLLVRDVNGGRRHLNMSDWASIDPKKAPKKLDQMCQEVQQGDMPLWFYTPLHPKAKISDQDKKTLCDWVKTQQNQVEKPAQTTK